MPQTLTVAVCVSDEVTLSDFVTPMEILGGLNRKNMGEIPYRVQIDYLSPTMDPVVSMTGKLAATFNPTLTYTDALASGKQFDIIWVPAGPLPNFATGDHRLPKDEIAFIAQQAPKAKYVMSVCGGTLQLAFAGVLAGKRATTNKALYRQIVALVPKDVEWVPQARWVVDGNLWTSSGVAAGSDMALAFVEHLAGPQVARVIRGIMEIPEVTEKDDPFAVFHGLV
ncbi:class I glutamine amidotransferase-like protein [Roridomyces roridus]|uniref:Class I glutamine amidotransferase-like protein n=1 Tax=Roridomyces roridus TaxID=1738132 RepID=A0AAD7FS33_9AGAR|nr:class I glutamine amidotransferase-like protein [Roridomyces roridus]